MQDLQVIKMKKVRYSCCDVNSVVDGSALQTDARVQTITEGKFTARF